jgi:threonine synthase
MAKIIPFQTRDGVALYSCARCGRMFKAYKATDYCPDCASVLYEEQLVEAQEEAMNQDLLDSILPPFPEDKLTKCVAELVEEGNQWALQASIDDPLAHQVAKC